MSLAFRTRPMSPMTRMVAKLVVKSEGCAEISIEMKGMQRMVVIGAPNPWNSKKNPVKTYSKAIAFEALGG